jgi:hypothetical protein
MKKLLVSALIASLMIVPAASAWAGSARTVEPQPDMIMKKKPSVHHMHMMHHKPMTHRKTTKHSTPMKTSGTKSPAARKVIPPDQQTPATPDAAPAAPAQ